MTPLLGAVGGVNKLFIILADGFFLVSVISVFSREQGNESGLEFFC